MHAWENLYLTLMSRAQRMAADEHANQTALQKLVVSAGVAWDKLQSLKRQGGA